MSKKHSTRKLSEKIAAESAPPLQAAIIKATDSDALPPKAKHLTALIKFSFYPESLQPMAELLVERSKKKAWIPVMKVLVTTHKLIRDAAKDFTKILSNQPGPFNLAYFEDTKDIESRNMSIFVQHYSLYLNHKFSAFKKLGFDYCHCKAVDEGKRLSSASADEVFPQLEIILDQMSSALDITDGDEINGVVGNLLVKESLTYVFKDVMRLWVCANAASCNLLERYFKLDKKSAQTTLRLYEQFVKLCNRTDRFVETCRMVGCNDGKEIPSLGDTPKKLLPQLRSYLKSASAKGATSAPTPVDDPFAAPGAGNQVGISPVDPTVNPDNPFL